MPDFTVWRIVPASFFVLFALAFAKALGPTGGIPGLSPETASAGLVAPASTCPDNRANGGARNIASARRSMACLINFARRRKKLRRYRTVGKLHWSARKKTRDILRCRSFSHGACGRRFDHWIKRSGYARRARTWYTGENIAWGSGSLGNVRAIFRAWMHSAGHRAAILDRGYADLGIGVTRGRMKGHRNARVWALHFGKRG